MRRIAVGFLLIFSVCEVLAQENELAVITITNPRTSGNLDEVVAIPWQSIASKTKFIDTANLRIVSARTKQPIAFQFEYLGRSQIQNLLLQVNLAPGSFLNVLLQKGKPESILAKTFARYVPERKDDFAWENDKIAFRMYGKAIEGTKEDASGIDVWVKRTDRLVINERYKRGQYHIDNGDGMDYYHVGPSLGAGNIAPYKADSIWYSGNYVTWKILDNGPIRSTFQLEYDEWDVAGQPVKAVKKVSLDAGSQLNRIEVNYQYSVGHSMPLVIGIVRRPLPGTILLDEKRGIMAYWEPQHGEDGITGVGTIVSSPVKMAAGKDQLLLETSTSSNRPVTYYTGAAWNKAGLINSAEDWFVYLAEFKKAIQQPLIVTVQ